jgi:hypothetical protein
MLEIEQTTAPLSGQAAAPTTEATGQTQTAPTPSGKTFSQDDVDRIVVERLDRERKKATEATEKQKRADDEKRLAEQNEFKTLSEQRAARIAELEASAQSAQATTETVKRYETALQLYRDAQFSNVPDHIKELLKDRPIDQQIDWLSKNMKNLSSVSGVPATPTDTPGPMTADEKRRQAARARL